jgi:fatty-acyl-CoA synthase
VTAPGSGLSVATSANPFRDATVGSLLDVVAARYPEGDALVLDDERLTFAEFRRRAETLARGLRALGIGRGDKVAIWLPNRPAWFIAQQACARLGAVVVALNPRYRTHELAYILAQSDSAALLLTDHLGSIDYLETLYDVLPDLARAAPGELDSERFPLLRHVIVDAEDPYAGCHRLSDVRDAGAESTEALGGSIAPDDLFTLLYTSGTTSFPKGAMISHRNCVPHGWHCGEVLGVTSEDRVLHALPAAGTWGGVNIPLTTWSHGACLVLMETWEPQRALVLMERERITIWNAVDAMATSLLSHPHLGRHDLSRLRTGAIGATGGGGHGLFEDVVARIGMPGVYQPYGMTECQALCLLHELDEPFALRIQSGIKPVPGFEARVVDPDTGAPCPPGREGELQARGDLVTRGYYKKPAETAAAFTADGWFRTGDLAVQDAAGHTFFKGRLRETLRISHHMVAPAEIEAFLMSHPAVAQAFVVGVPDPETNEAPVAYVILRAGADLAAEDLRSFCRGRIASFKIPRAVCFVRDVPRTPGPHGDKVQKGKLREQALCELGLGRP